MTTRIITFHCLTLFTIFPTKLVGGDTEVVPCNQPSSIVSDGGWRREWMSEPLRLAVTSDVLQPDKYRTEGLLHVWSLQTGLVMRSIRFPSLVQVIAGGPDSPVVVVAGSPYGKFDQNPPFVWTVNLLTGEAIAKFQPWPKTSEGKGIKPHYPTITTGWIIPKDRKVLLAFGETGALYDLTDPQRAPQMVRLGPRQDQLEKPHDASLPSWFVKPGETGNRLMLNDIAGQGGIWRRDTLEQVMPLGLGADTVSSWHISPDGKRVMTFYEKERRSGLVWDLATLQVNDTKEGAAIISSDGNVLRSFKSAKNGSWQVVSTLRQTREERVDYETAVQKSPVTDLPPEAHFSADGSICVVRTPQGSSLLQWTKSWPIGPEVSALSGLPSDSVITGFDVAASAVIINPAKDWERGDGRCHLQAWEWKSTARRARNLLSVSDSGHPIAFHFSSCPEIAGQCIDWHFRGSSMGAYRFGLLVRADARGNWRNISEYDWSNDGGRNMTARDRLSYMIEGSAIVRTPDGKEVLVAWYQSHIRTIDIATGNILDEVERGDLASPWSKTGLAAPLAGIVLAPLRGGGAEVYKVGVGGTLNSLAQLWTPVDGSWMIMLGDGRYAMSAAGPPPLSFRRSGKVYPVEDLDAELNQPDAVAEALGASIKTVNELRRKRERRQERMATPAALSKNKEKPAIRLLSPPPMICDGARLSLQVEITGGSARPVNVDVFVNDVPAYGKSGFPVEIQGVDKTLTTLHVPLTPGSNKVQLAARGAEGAVSSRELFYVHRSAASVTPRRYILAIGISDYENNELDLTCAAQDAADIAEALEAAAGGKRECRTLILTDKNANQIRILAAKGFFQDSRPEDEVIVFAAGHGDTDANGDFYFCPADFQPGNGAHSLPFKDLEGLFDGVVALNRLLLIDACHSGRLTDEDFAQIERRNRRLDARGVNVRHLPAVSGAKKIPGNNGGMFRDLSRTSGATVLAASAGVENALEAGNQQNGFFTHALLIALRTGNADNNKDGVIRASELINYAAAAVSDLSAGWQHPDSRFTNLAVDFPVVPAKESPPPTGPEHTLKQYIEWLSQPGTAGVHPRLMNLFAREVDYFGKKKTKTDIRADEVTSNRPLQSRTDFIKRIKAQPPAPDGSVSLTYDYEYSFFKLVPVSDLNTQNAKNGDWQPVNRMQGQDGRVTHLMLRKMGSFPVEARLQIIEGEWRICGIRIIKK